MKATALLLTGVPGVGKTTVIRRVADALSQRRIRGFFTSEIRESGHRAGFRITSLDGRSAILAHVDLTAAYRVGRYGVDVSALDDIVAHTMSTTSNDDLFLIDEIGKMECFSVSFTRAVSELLDLRCPVVATIGLSSGGFMSQVKGRPDVELWTVTAENRDDMPAKVIAWLGEN